MISKNTTIRVSGQLKRKLDKLKIHPREPYEEAIERLIENGKIKTHKK